MTSSVTVRRGDRRGRGAAAGPGFAEGAFGANCRRGRVRPQPLRPLRPVAPVTLVKVVGICRTLILRDG